MHFFGSFFVKVCFFRFFAEEDKKEHPVLSYLQGLQKEMGADSAPWSTNLLKAATYICDKLQTATPPSTQTSAQNLFFSSLNNNSSSTPSNGGAGGGGLISRLRRTGSSVSLSGKKLDLHTDTNTTGRFFCRLINFSDDFH